jgi:hypothetical protein
MQTINVYGMKVKVILKPVLEHNGQIVAGLFLPTEKKIFLATENRTKQEIYSTFIHELLHAALFRIGYYTTGAPHEVEEMIVDNLANILTEVFDFDGVLDIEKSK